ncbi:MAG: hypothetical protein ABIY70_17060 [Capsulimonas sp.]|uniref:hypothetical protein n=1 Tax=Capsulimonas sp. TaxID=2494211 RepID=UPI003263F068
MKVSTLGPDVRSLTIQVPAKLIERMDDAARAVDRSRSSYLRRVIVEALEARDGKEADTAHVGAV